MQVVVACGCSRDALVESMNTQRSRSRSHTDTQFTGKNPIHASY